MSEKKYSKPETFITIVGVILFLLITFSLGFYYYNFKDNGISDDPGNWGVFGDYMGGTLNTLIGLANLIVLTYITLQIIRIEDERNINNYNNSVFPAFCAHINQQEESLAIEIHSYGLGPVIIKKLRLINNKEQEEANFTSFFQNLNIINLTTGIDITTSLIEDYTIKSSFEKEIVNIKILIPQSDTNYTLVKDEFKRILSNINGCKLLIEYTDIFEKDIKIKEEKLSTTLFW